LISIYFKKLPPYTLAGFDLTSRQLHSLQAETTTTFSIGILHAQQNSFVCTYLYTAIVLFINNEQKLIRVWLWKSVFLETLYAGYRNIKIKTNVFRALSKTHSLIKTIKRKNNNNQTKREAVDYVKNQLIWFWKQVFVSRATDFQKKRILSVFYVFQLAKNCHVPTAACPPWGRFDGAKNLTRNLLNLQVQD
jgi:hypothetical protein